MTVPILPTMWNEHAVYEAPSAESAMARPMVAEWRDSPIGATAVYPGASRSLSGGGAAVHVRIACMQKGSHGAGRARDAASPPLALRLDCRGECDWDVSGRH